MIIFASVIDFGSHWRLRHGDADADADADAAVAVGSRLFLFGSNKKLC